MESPEESPAIMELRKKIDELNEKIEDENTAIAVLKEKEAFLVANRQVTGTTQGINPADFKLLAELTDRGVMVTCAAAEKEFDFVSRFFAPAVGVDEDPVTGSAHCCLAPFWASRLAKVEMVAFQASRRGGVVRTRLDGDRVHLAGQAITVLDGQLQLEVPTC